MNGELRDFRLYDATKNAWVAFTVPEESIESLSPNEIAQRYMATAFAYLMFTEKTKPPKVECR